MDIMDRLYEQGRHLEKNKSKKDRKGKGVFYTPLEIVDYMTCSMLERVNLTINPYVRILDISCGAGYFLLKAYELLEAQFRQQYDEILKKHPELLGILSRQTIGEFIIRYNLWGADIDPDAVSFVRSALQKAAGSSCTANILCADSLLSGVHSEEHPGFWKQGYDIIIGNPPYIGHKAVSGEYKKELYQYYKDVYRDKADVSYCFFKRGMELLNQNGRLCYITSRYFMEGPSAVGLRAYLKSFVVEEIIDFGDSRVFQDAGVSVCIISVRKGSDAASVKVKKPKEKQALEPNDPLDHGFSEFAADPALMKDQGWVLLEPDRMELFQQIDMKSTHQLEDLFDSYQGIITGCDKAFIVSQRQAEELQIEKPLLRPWIKNSNIGKLIVSPTDKQIIYTDLIDTPERYPMSIAFVEVHRERLANRRECLRNVRHWYQLQWGRESEIFERDKIIYPYKASENRFAVDRQGLYCSADVYSLLLKKEWKEAFSLDYIAALLNSRLMEFYFKCFAKRISPSLFDYYPNTVLRIRLKLDAINKNISDLADRMVNVQNPTERKCILQAIDREIYKMYGLTKKQIQMVENSAGE